jgi:hypothetical protein
LAPIALAIFLISLSGPFMKEAPVSAIAWHPLSQNDIVSPAVDKRFPLNSNYLVNTINFNYEIIKT